VVSVVNPYTFTPLCPTPARSAPSGHARGQAEGLSGWVSVSVTARTPLLIGGFDSVPNKVLEPPRDAVTGDCLVPGSGLLGALRSTHEALVGGCLRVLDVDYVPVHRHAAIAGHLDGTQFAVVRQVDEGGMPTAVQVCSDVVSVRHDLCGAHPAGPLTTGDVLTWPQDAPETVGSRKLLRPRAPRPSGRGGERRVTGIDAGQIVKHDRPVAGGYTLLITSTSARPKARRQGRRPPAYFAAGRPGGEDREYLVDVEAREDLRRALVGADDRRRGVRLEGLRDVGGREVVPVTWPRDSDPDDGGPVVGYRWRVTERLSVGQPVWVQVKDGRVRQVRLSRMWRYQGSGPVGARVGEAGPCTDPAQLCPTCRIFGSAGTDSKDDDGSRQWSYRGHLRVDDAAADGPVSLTDPVRLAPRATPKPSAGQFYLDHSDVPAGDLRQPRGEEPAAVWGSKADGEAGKDRPLRGIAGRKFYWRTSAPLTEPARGVAREHQRNEAMSVEARLVEAGARFVTRLTVDNLTAAQIGSVLAALDPRLLWAKDDVVTSVGGGKPFGFGAVTITVEEARLTRTADRYRSAVPETVSVDACVKAFRAAAKRDSEAVVSPGARFGWEDLRAVLTLDRVENSEVWYPGIEGRPGEEPFDQAFEFFSRTRGQILGPDDNPEFRHLVSLARPSAALKKQRVRPRIERGGAGR